MSRTITIHFPAGQAEEFDLIHRLRNFGEDVFRFLRANDWGSVDIEEIDRAISFFSTHDIKRSKLRRLTAWLDAEAERHNLLISMEIASP